MGSPRDRPRVWNPKFPHAQSSAESNVTSAGSFSDEAEQTAARGETPLVREREPAEHERLRVFLAESEEGIVRGVPEVQTEAREEGKEGDARQYHSRARGGQQPFSSTRRVRRYLGGACVLSVAEISWGGGAAVDGEGA